MLLFSFLKGMESPRPESKKKCEKSKIKITITPDVSMDWKSRNGSQMGSCSSTSTNNTAGHSISETMEENNGSRKPARYAAVVQYKSSNETDIDKVYISKTAPHRDDCECKLCTENDSAFDLDSMSIMELSRCVDFGISDFLCYNDEIELDVSSDTEASFLDATPPHRFSDSDFEPFEAMSITLDTTLNLNNTLDLNESQNSPSRTLTSSAPPKMEIQPSLSEERDEFNSRDSSLSTLITENFTREPRIPIFPQRRSLYDSSSSKRRCLAHNRSNSQSLPRPFRRHISLPASMFYKVLDKSGIFDENDIKASRLFRGDSILVATAKNNSSSISTTASPNGVAGRFLGKNRRRMSTQDSAESSTGSGSLANASDDDCNSVNDWMVDDANNSFSSDRDEIEAASAFTSELEKRSLLLRHVRKLVRQETTGNFAPPDYCI